MKLNVVFWCMCFIGTFLHLPWGKLPTLKYENYFDILYNDSSVNYFYPALYFTAFHVLCPLFIHWSKSRAPLAGRGAWLPCVTLRALEVNLCVVVALNFASIAPANDVPGFLSELQTNCSNRQGCKHLALKCWRRVLWLYSCWRRLLWLYRSWHRMLWLYRSWHS